MYPSSFLENGMIFIGQTSSELSTHLIQCRSEEHPPGCCRALLSHGMSWFEMLQGIIFFKHPEQGLQKPSEKVPSSST